VPKCSQFGHKRIACNWLLLRTLRTDNVHTEQMSDEKTNKFARAPSQGLGGYFALKEYLLELSRFGAFAMRTESDAHQGVKVLGFMSFYELCRYGSAATQSLASITRVNEFSPEFLGRPLGAL